MAILTIDEAAAQLGIDSQDFATLDELQGYIDGIGAAIENHKLEAVEQRTVVEDQELRGDTVIWLHQVPVISLTSFVSLNAGGTWNPTDFHVTKSSGRVRLLFGAALTGLVQITYEAGYAPADIPANYKRAARIILQHSWETQRGVGGVSGGVVGPEEQRWELVKQYSIPRKALEWLGPPRTLAR